MLSQDPQLFESLERSTHLVIHLGHVFSMSGMLFSQVVQPVNPSGQRHSSGADCAKTIID